MRKSFFPSIISLALLLAAQTASAENKAFAALTDCWTALNGAPILGARAGMKQDFHLIQTQHMSDANRDTFLVLNHDGAQMLNPTSSMDPKASVEGMSAYQMTIVPVGEKNKMQVGYFTYAKNPKADSAGWIGPVGWAKAQDARYAKYEKDPVKTLDSGSAREALRMVFKEKAISQQVELEKTKERMKFWNATDYMTADGRITRYTPEFHRQRIETALSLVNACSEVGDETIKQAGLQQKKTLEIQKEFLASMGSSKGQATPASTRASGRTIH